jgi:hypothetical protein
VRGPEVFGDGSARLSFRSMSGDHRVSLRDARGSKPSDDRRQADERQSPAAAAAKADAGDRSGDEHEQLAVLRALERGEIDVEEATRRLEESTHA